MNRIRLVFIFFILGVTAPHPIFSTTYNDWRLAGELEVGEKVLTYHGEASVLSNVKKEGSEIVYNLEVKDLHNFLVGNVGVVVHNGCGWLRDFIKLADSKIIKKYAKHAPDFGLPGNYNTANGNLWKQKIKEFVGSDGKRHFPDLNYKDQFNGILVLEESTGLMVLMKADGEFVTAFKLGANQISQVINHNYLN
ncbi:MAG TPA: colicin D domain-containing protein [Saprospiraceae bacterium]|nr:colicin D domain-containing protein [Saprospiraceae bacterium]